MRVCQRVNKQSCQYLSAGDNYKHSRTLQSYSLLVIVHYYSLTTRLWLTHWYSLLVVLIKVITRSVPVSPRTQWLIRCHILVKYTQRVTCEREGPPVRELSYFYTIKHKRKFKAGPLWNMRCEEHSSIKKAERNQISLLVLVKWLKSHVTLLMSDHIT